MNSFQMEGSFQEKSSTNSRQSEQVKKQKTEGTSYRRHAVSGHAVPTGLNAEALPAPLPAPLTSASPAHPGLI